MKIPKYHIFVCTSSRTQGEPKGFCGSNSSADLIPYLEEEINDRGLEDIVLTNTGCFKLCEKGPIMVVYPHGWWYGGLNEESIDEILDAMEEDRPAEHLLLN